MRDAHEASDRRAALDRVAEHLWAMGAEPPGDRRDREDRPITEGRDRRLRCSARGAGRPWPEQRSTAARHHRCLRALLDAAQANVFVADADFTMCT
jgi:hypothetical protein